MFHDLRLRHDLHADPRPRSAVGHGVGVAGLVGLTGWIVVARTFGMDGPYAALVGVLACGLPMVAWSLAVDKVHRRASTGIDWAHPRPWRESVDTSLVKLAGLWATWGAIALVYATFRFYWDGPYTFAMWVLASAAPVLFAASIPYVLWLDRYLVEPRDGAWALGAWLIGAAPLDREAVAAHARSWAVKGFFLAFMIAIVPGGFGDFVRADLSRALGDPVSLANWLITLMFVVDVAFALSLIHI